MATPTFILPSAPTYTEGFVNGLNVYPNPTNFVANQVPFTRATTATRVNAAGLVELVPYNLFQYSEQFDNAAWTKSNVTITANTTAAPNNTLTADTMSVSSSTSRVIAANVLTAGTYTISVWTKVLSGSGLMRFNLTIDGVGVSSTFFEPTTEWQRFTYTFTAATSATLISFRGLTFVGDLAIWGAQLVEGTDALPYLLTETRLNRPRVDFSLGGCPSLLLEPQRTNLLTYSEDFTNASWAKNDTTLSENSTISPDGTLDASTISLSNSNSSLRRAVVLGSGTYTFSFYVKKLSTTSGATMRLLSVVDTLSVSLNFTPTEQWVRYSYTFTAVTSVTQVQLRAQNLIGNVAVWGAQLEAGAYPTTYIPTTSASVTRNTDTFTLSNVFTNNMISSAGGTWFVDLRNNTAKIRDNAGGMYLGVDANNCFRIRNISAALLRFTIDKNIAGISTNLFTTTTDDVKLAIKWNGTTGDVFVNGVKVVTATAFTFTALQDLISSAGIPFYINSMALYNTPISDAECIQITT
jgi:hypothetical protein